MKKLIITTVLYFAFGALIKQIVDHKENIPNAFKIAIVCIVALTYIGLYRIIKLTIKTLKK